MKKQSKKILVILMLGIVLAGVFLILTKFSTQAQEIIKIVPSSFSGDPLISFGTGWQNPEAAFSQDLDEQAPFGEFNTENSAYPMLLFDAQVEFSECQQGENRPCGIDVGACEIGVQICSDGAREECLGAVGHSQEICDEVDNDCDGEIDEDDACLEPGSKQGAQIEKTLILSDFGVMPSENTEIRLVQLRLSLAGKGEIGDKLVIDYFYQDQWQSLAEFDLENEISNALNGGYFLYGLPVFENWQDFDNLKIRFTSLGEGRVFLDAAWLEVETEESTGVAPLQIESTGVAPLQILGEEKFSLKSIKKDWKRDEEPEFELVEAPQDFWSRITSLFQEKEIETVLIGPAGERVLGAVVVKGNKIKIFQPGRREFRPGLYKLKVKIREGGEEFIQENDFRWGVLAINTNRSVFLSNEQAYLQMAALNDSGHTICDANLKLEITSPGGGRTSANVQRSGKCGPDNVTDAPDYFAYYQVGESGTYQMKLTNLDNGYEITDSFEVREWVSFDVERIGPTRIWPWADYQMTTKIRANQNFVGEIIETVPSSFEIKSQIPDSTFYFLDSKIVWQVDWKAGETYELKYTFDAPDVSPYLYLLGPLEFYGSPSTGSGSPRFSEARRWQVAADAPLTNTRARSVQVLAGQYAGSGTGGQNSNTNQSFASVDFQLAESSAAIKDAFVVLEAQLNGSADRGNVTGHILAFDACSACTPDPWAGLNRVEDNQGSTILQYQDVTGSIYVRLLIDVTSEAQLAAYTGGGSTMSFALGYRFNNGATAATIDSAKAKLFITYTYDDTSTNITNTVIYPLESTVAGDQGTRATSQATACTKNSTCPTFTYNMDIAEFSQKVSQWFEVGGFNDGNSATDVTRNVNIEGTDVDSSTFYLEAAQGSAQGNWSQAWWSGVSGFAENTAQTLEHYFAAGMQYIIGGEVFETYTASAGAATKTRTVSFPLGVVTNDIAAISTDYTATTTVYFAESGVSIKKAWFRILISGDDATGAHTAVVKTKVGNNAQSGALTYSQDPGGTIFTQLSKIFHVILSADYTELAGATATAGKDVSIAVQSNSLELDGVSAELMITYTYTGESGGYLTSLALFAGQSATAGISQSETLTTANSVLPETSGAKTIRAAALRASYSISDSDLAMPTANATVDANLATASPSCSNAYYGDTDAADAYFEYYKLVTSAMNTTDNQSYSACYTNNGAADTSAGAKMNGWLIYTYQVDLPTFEQAVYRWYANTDTTDVGSPLAATSTAAALSSTGAAFRLRLLLHIGAGQLAASAENFKLQFAQQSGTCDTGFVGETYADVTAATVIAYNNNTPADGATLTANAEDPLHGTDTIVNQTYEELNNFTNSVAAIPAAQDGKWDFALKDNGATASTAYCFRVRKSNDTDLNTYTVIPQITTAAAAAISIIRTTDGIISYGAVALNSSTSTDPAGINDVETFQNDSNLAEKFSIQTSNATGGTTWPWEIRPAATSLSTALPPLVLPPGRF